MTGANTLWVGERQPSDRPGVERADRLTGGLAAIDRREAEDGRFDAVVAPAVPEDAGRLFAHARTTWPDVACFLYGETEREGFEGTAVCGAAASARLTPEEFLDRVVGAARSQRPYPLAEDEPARLAVIEELSVEDGAFDEAADRLAGATEAPMALVGLVGDHTERIVGLSGVGAAAVPPLCRGEVMCAYTLLADGPVEVTDLETDPRARSSALTDRLGLRSYLGRSVEVAGQPVGTVALVDARPRGFGTDERAALRERAAGVEAELAASRAGRPAPPTRTSD
jgi:GAF domain-containing protein